MAEAEVSRLEIVVTSNTSDAEAGLKRLCSRFAELQGRINQLTTRGLGQKLSTITKALNKAELAGVAKAADNTAKSISKTAKAGSNFPSLEERLKEVDELFARIGASSQSTKKHIDGFFSFARGKKFWEVGKGTLPDSVSLKRQDKQWAAWQEARGNTNGAGYDDPTSATREYIDRYETIKETLDGVQASAAATRERLSELHASYKGVSETANSIGQAKEQAEGLGKACQEAGKESGSVQRTADAVKAVGDAAQEASQKVTKAYTGISSAFRGKVLVRGISGGDQFDRMIKYAEVMGKTGRMNAKPTADAVEKVGEAAQHSAQALEAVNEQLRQMGSSAQTAQKTASVANRATDSVVEQAQGIEGNFFSLRAAVEMILNRMPALTNAFVSFSTSSLPSIVQVGAAIQRVLGIVVKFASAIKKAAAALAGMAASAVKFAGAGIAKAFRASIAPVRQLTTVLGRLGNAVTGVLKRFARIAIMRLFRSAVMAIGKALQEGIGNLYNYSSAINGHFMTAMDAAASSMLYLKNSIAAAASPIIEALIPYLQAAVNWVVHLLNIFNQFAASMRGLSVFTRAKLTAEKFDDTLDSIGDTSKKTKKETDKLIASWDEITNIKPDKDDTSGKLTDAQKAAQAARLMFEEVQIDNAISDFASDLREQIAKGDWESAGALLADKLNSILPSKEWFEKLGENLGRRINNGIQFALGFLREFDFHALGERIGAAVNKAIGQIDWQDFGALLARKILAMVDFAFGFLGELDTGAAARALSDLLIGYFNELSDWIEGKDWSELGRKAGQKVLDFITNMKWGEIWASLRRFLAAGIWAIIDWVLAFDSALQQGLTGIDEKIRAAAETVAKDLTDLIPDPIYFEQLGMALANLINGAITFALTFLRNFGAAKVGRSVAAFLKGAIGRIHWDELGALFVQGFTTFADLAIGFFENFPAEELGTAISKFLLGGINELIVWLKAKDWKKFGWNIGTKIVELISAIEWNEIGQSIWELLSTALKSTTQFLTGIDDVLTEKFNGLNNTIILIGSTLAGLTLSATFLKDLSLMRSRLHGAVTFAEKLKGLAVAGAFMVIEAALVYKFDKDFLLQDKDGNSADPAGLIKDGLTTVLGTALSSAVMQATFRGQSGAYTAGISLIISALASFKASWDATKNEVVITKKALITNLWAGLKAALGTGIFTVGIMGMQLIPGVALAFTVGATLATLVTMAQAIITNENKYDIFGGDDGVEYTAKELEDYVNTLFDWGEVQPKLELTAAKIGKVEELKKTLSETRAELQATLTKLNLGMELDQQDYKDIKTLLFSPENGYIPTLQALLNEEKNLLQATLTLSPAVDSNGKVISADLLAALGHTNETLQNSINGIGTELAEYLEKGVTDKLTKDEQIVVQNLTKWLDTVVNAANKGRTKGGLVVGTEVELSGMGKGQAEETAKKIEERAKETRQQIQETYSTEKKELYSILEMAKSAQKGLLDLGRIEEAKQYTEQIAELEKRIQELDVTASSEAEYKRIIAEAQQELKPEIDKMFSILTNRDVATETKDWFRNQLKDAFDWTALNENMSPEKIAEYFNKLIDDTLYRFLDTDSFNFYKKMKDLGLINPTDMFKLLPEDIQSQLVPALQQSLYGSMILMRDVTPELQKKYVTILAGIYSGDDLLTVVKELGLTDALEFAKGLVEGTPEVASSAQQLATEAQNNLSTVDEKSSETTQNLQEVQDKATETANQVSTDATTANTDVQTVVDNVTNAGTSTKNTMDDINANITSTQTTVENAANDMVTDLKTADWAGAGQTAADEFTKPFNGLKVKPKVLWGTESYMGTTIGVPTVEFQGVIPFDDYGFAQGGFPDEGQMFIAREAGPELVGRIGNRTAVANNDQIVDAIREGVFDAMTAAMNSQGEKEVRVYLDGKEIATSTRKYNSQTARALGV